MFKKTVCLICVICLLFCSCSNKNEDGTTSEFIDSSMISDQTTSFQQTITSKPEETDSDKEESKKMSSKTLQVQNSSSNIENVFEEEKIDHPGINSKMLSVLNMQTNEYIYSKDIKVSLNAVECGIVPNDKEKSLINTILINSLIESAQPYTEIFFPKGTYYIESSSVSGIVLQNKSNLIIRGDDAKFVNVSYCALNNATASNSASMIFYINACKNIKIEGIKTDYINHTTLTGIITEIKDGYTYIQAYSEFYSGDKNPLVGGEKIFSFGTYDSYNRPDLELWFGDKPISLIAENATEGRFCIKGSYGKVGDQISTRFVTTAPAITVWYTSGFCIKNVHSVSCPAMTVYAPCGNENFTFIGFEIRPDDKSRNLFATNIDCIHIKGLRGKLKLVDCVFEGLGDDSLNVHSRLAIVDSASENTLRLLDGWSKGQLDPSWGAQGDVLEFFDNEYRSLGKAKIVSINGFEVTFDSLPKGIKSGYTVLNTAFSPDVLVENCRISCGRARAFVLQTKNAVIRNCSIEKLRLAAIIISPDFDRWFEGGFSENILIYNNTINDCCLAPQCKNFGVFLISGCHDMSPFPNPEVKAHGNISIIGNSVVSCGSAPVYAEGVKNLVQDGNMFPDKKN